MCRRNKFTTYIFLPKMVENLPGVYFPYGPAHDKTYNKTCVTRKDSVQPVQPLNMARILIYPFLDSPEAVALAISEDSDQTARMRRLI